MLWGWLLYEGFIVYVYNCYQCKFYVDLDSLFFTYMGFFYDRMLMFALWFIFTRERSTNS